MHHSIQYGSEAHASPSDQNEQAHAHMPSPDLLHTLAQFKSYLVL